MSKENAALDHVAWLARELRHTDTRDRRTSLAIKKGWVVKIPGVMTGDYSHMFRLKFTDAGRIAWRCRLQIRTGNTCNLSIMDQANEPPDSQRRPVAHEGRGASTQKAPA